MKTAQTHLWSWARKLREGFSSKRISHLLCWPLLLARKLAPALTGGQQLALVPANLTAGRRHPLSWSSGDSYCIFTRSSRGDCLHHESAFFASISSQKSEAWKVWPEALDILSNVGKGWERAGEWMLPNKWRQSCWWWKTSLEDIQFWIYSFSDHSELKIYID